MKKEWNPYDPTWLVTLARTYFREDPVLAQSLSQCKMAFIPNDKKVYFVDNIAPNQPGSEWQIDTNILVETPHGTLIFDRLKDGRIGGVELVLYDGPEKRELSKAIRRRRRSK